MLDAILSPDNLNLAYTKVAHNKGTYGIDGMTIEQLLPFLEAHGEALRQSLRLADAGKFLEDINSSPK